MTLHDFGYTRHCQRQALTLNQRHDFGAALINEVHFGFNHRRIPAVTGPNDEQLGY